MWRGSKRSGIFPWHSWVSFRILGFFVWMSGHPVTSEQMEEPVLQDFFIKNSDTVCLLEPAKTLPYFETFHVIFTHFLERTIFLYMNGLISVSYRKYSCDSFYISDNLSVFENRVLRWIFGLKRDENGGCRRLHNEKLHTL